MCSYGLSSRLHKFHPPRTSRFIHLHVASILPARTPQSAPFLVQHELCSHTLLVPLPTLILPHRPCDMGRDGIPPSSKLRFLGCTLPPLQYRELQPPSSSLRPHGHKFNCLPARDGKTRRHNHLRDRISVVLRESSVQLHIVRHWPLPSPKPLPLNYTSHWRYLQIDDSDLSLRPLGFDNMVPNPYINCRNPSALRTPSEETHHVKLAKWVKYTALCASLGAYFYPLGFATHGNMSPAICHL